MHWDLGFEPICMHIFCDAAHIFLLCCKCAVILHQLHLWYISLLVDRYLNLYTVWWVGYSQLYASILFHSKLFKTKCVHIMLKMLANYIKQTVTITLLQSKLQGLNAILFFSESIWLEKPRSVAAEGGWISKIVLHVNSGGHRHACSTILFCPLLVKHLLWIGLILVWAYS